LSPSKTKADDTAGRPIEQYHRMILLTPCRSTPYRAVEL
jgi:hypothetical protein